LTHNLSAEDWDLIVRITTDKVSHLDEVMRARHGKKFSHLHKTQHPPSSQDNKKTVINLSEAPLEEAAVSALGKGLNYAVTPGHMPVKDIICGVEKAIRALPIESAEEIRQETVRILKSSRVPKNILSGAERNALRSLKAMTCSPFFRLTKAMPPR
jgi:hypothetical protein